MFDSLMGFPVLSTPRLKLRKLKISDNKDIFECTSDIKVTQYELWQVHKNLNETNLFIQSVLCRYDNGVFNDWAIELNHSKKIIGMIGFTSVNKFESSAEVGFDLNSKYWNNGYMTEALNAILTYGFNYMNLSKINAKTIAYNKRCMRVLEKCGFTYLERLINYIIMNGENTDVLWYAKKADCHNLHTSES